MAGAARERERPCEFKREILSFTTTGAKNFRERSPLPLPTQSLGEGPQCPAKQSPEGTGRSGTSLESTWGRTLSGPCHTLEEPSPSLPAHSQGALTSRAAESSHLQPPSWPVLQGCPSPRWGGSRWIPSFPSLLPSSPMGHWNPTLGAGVRRPSLRAEWGANLKGHPFRRPV